jgi:hypothetical protein
MAIEVAKERSQVEPATVEDVLLVHKPCSSPPLNTQITGEAPALAPASSAAMMGWTPPAT